MFGVEEAGWLQSMATVELDKPSDPNNIRYILTAIAEIERDREAAERENYEMWVCVRSGMETWPSRHLQRRLLKWKSAPLIGRPSFVMTEAV